MIDGLHILPRIKCLRTIHNRGHELLVLDGQLLADVLGQLSGRDVVVYSECFAECTCLPSSNEPEVYRVNSIRCSSGNGLSTQPSVSGYADMFVECSGIINHLVENLHITPHYIMPRHVHAPPNEPVKNIIDDFYTYSYQHVKTRTYPDLNES